MEIGFLRMLRGKALQATFIKIVLVFIDNTFFFHTAEEATQGQKNKEKKIKKKPVTRCPYKEVRRVAEKINQFTAELSFFNRFQDEVSCFVEFHIFLL